jgi:hypothetical protein
MHGSRNLLHGRFHSLMGHYFSREHYIKLNTSSGLKLKRETFSFININEFIMIIQ